MIEITLKKDGRIIQRTGDPVIAQRHGVKVTRRNPFGDLKVYLDEELSTRTDPECRELISRYLPVSEGE